MEIVIYITMWTPREKEFPDRIERVSSFHVKFRFDLSLSRSCERSLARGGMSCKIPARRFRFVNPCILERTRHLCHFSTIVYSVILRKRPVLHFIFPLPVFPFIPCYVFEMPRNSLHPTALPSSSHPFICNLFTLSTLRNPDLIIG